MNSKMWAFNVREIGSGHIAQKKPCQDASLSEYSNDYAIGIVADGHGGDMYFRSERGSQLATMVTMDVLKDVLRETNNFSNVSRQQKQIIEWQRQIASSILTRWNDKIEQDYYQDMFDVNNEDWRSAYGTTLIAIVKTNYAFFGLQIGDGKCVAIDTQGLCSQPIPWDEDCFQNLTTSLCDKNAINKFRFAFIMENLPSAAFIASDGVDDTYTTDELLYAFYCKLWSMIQQSKEQAIGDLQVFLPQMTLKGSHDDISIAMVQ